MFVVAICGLAHAASEGSVVLPPVCGFRYVGDIGRPVALKACVCWSSRTSPIWLKRSAMAYAWSIAADIAGDGDTALELLSLNAYDIAVLDAFPDRPVTRSPSASSPPGVDADPHAHGCRPARHKASGFEIGADDYLTKPFALRELVLRLRALDRRRAHNRPPVREIAGLRLDPFRREVFRDGRYIALTRKQFAVLEIPRRSRWRCRQRRGSAGTGLG